MTDKVNDIVSVHEFFVGQGLKLDTPLILQDNMSTLQLVSSSGKEHRNTHMLVRQELMKERVVVKDVTLKYVETRKMAADVLTKPLQGALFRARRWRLLGNGILNAIEGGA